jgi:hypothetical protein
MRVSIAVEAEGIVILSCRDFYGTIPITLIIKEYRVLQGHVLALMHVLKLYFGWVKFRFKALHRSPWGVNYVGKFYRAVHTR